MIFTLEQIKEIEYRLSRLGQKDTQFEDAELPIQDTDIVAIVQNSSLSNSGTNKKVTIGNLFAPLKDRIINLETAVDTLQQTVDGHTEQIVQLSNDVDDLNQRVSQNEGNITTIQEILPGKVDILKTWGSSSTTEDIIVRINNLIPGGTENRLRWTGYNFNFQHTGTLSAPTINGKTIATDDGVAHKISQALIDYYTKTEVDNLISLIPKFKVEVVPTLPVTDISTTTIYLVPNTSPTSTNLYKEYLYVNNAWECIGEASIDPSNFVTIDTTQTITGKKYFSKSIQVSDEDFSLFTNTDTSMALCLNTTTATGTNLGIEFKGTPKSMFGYDNNTKITYMHSESPLKTFGITEQGDLILKDGILESNNNALEVLTNRIKATTFDFPLNTNKGKIRFCSSVLNGSTPHNINGIEILDKNNNSMAAINYHASGAYASKFDFTFKSRDSIGTLRSASIGFINESGNYGIYLEGIDHYGPIDIVKDSTNPNTIIGAAVNGTLFVPNGTINIADTVELSTSDVDGETTFTDLDTGNVLNLNINGNLQSEINALFS